MYFVFDVESVGLHGEGFAVAYVILDDNWEVVEEKSLACLHQVAKGTNEGRNWVSGNVTIDEINCYSTREVRERFWIDYLAYKEKGANFVADCAWPVEARFLMQCIREDIKDREFRGPYPLFDLSSILLAKGKDPIGNYGRNENELPCHNPLRDARQTARILKEVMI